MIYSCFNEKAGHYEYFSDDRALPVNGDFPVPQLQKLQAGRVGVPARDAGRSLPKGAKRAGVGWQARGAIVQCDNQPMRGLAGFGADDEHKTAKLVGFAIISGLAIYGLLRVYMDTMVRWGER
jgi:hypothetical protein